jgi:hypothetical protein
MSSKPGLAKALAFALALAALRGAAAFPDDAPASEEGFRAEGSAYIAVASASAASPQAAEARARSAALHALFSGLGKDGLFAEVFAASPPLGLDFELLESAKEGQLYQAKVQLRVDDESIRIVERGPYLAAALGILDKAEAASDEAEARRAGASAAEAEADLGAALGQYGMAVDSCRSALQLIDPVEDPSVFSTKGKRTAPELKKVLASLLSESSAGIERVKQAEAALAADASSQAASDVADAALKAVEEAQSLLDEVQPILSDLSAYGEDRLSPLRDRISVQRRGLSDSLAALKRAQAAQPKGKTGYAMDKLDFASRRLATADVSLGKAYRAVDLEIRDPSARRAERARALRWAFLHEPREYLSVRAFLPFKLAAGEGGLGSNPFEACVSLEGAFSMGAVGAWVRSQARMERLDISPADSSGDEQSFTQSFDFGFWGKTLFFAGYSWDWLRRVDGESLPKYGAIRLGIGGVYAHRASGEEFRRADWLLTLSYDLPYHMPGFNAWNYFNLGAETQFRLGSIVLLEASLERRLHEETGLSYTSVLSWAVGAGLRLPPPFTVGAEYFGDVVQPLGSDGKLGDAEGFEGGRFRFFIQYSI